ncbi:hypothetical protein [Micromonospora carbonacea]|uniref:hypothetical protein n=1 Tax=Micromonospora carbonacea TaxID=47853 RepID=UPI00371F8F16
MTALEPTHDSDGWETVAGWFWACRTCLDRGWSASEAEAQAKKSRHDAGPIPWWVKRINQPEPQP